MKRQSRLEVAKKYAVALWETAAQDDNMLKVFQDVQKLQTACRDQTLLKKLNMPLLSKTQKDDLVSTIAKSLNLNIITKNFLTVLIENRRFDVLENVLNTFKDIYFQKNNILKVVVETAQPLNNNQEQKLKTGLEKKLKKEVWLSYKLNENLLGGLTLYYDSVQIDDSLKNKLNTIQQVMKGLK
ncbi:MAG: ATP synthase F1 subunit delta [Alphaproteobacteria bacterium]|nr:ATP synthase F1 subunit delta [Alphaproteobacteria bacterium]